MPTPRPGSPETKKNKQRGSRRLPLKLLKNQSRSEKVAPLAWESLPYKRLQMKYGVIPNQSSDWCGNLRRHRDCIAPKDGDCHASVITGSQ